MGRKKKSSHVLSDDDSDEEGTGSVSEFSGSIPNEEEVDVGDSPGDAFSKVIENISSKRLSTRLTAMKQANSILLHNPFWASDLASHKLSMMMSVTRSCRGGKGDERVLGLRLSEAAVLTFGRDDELIKAVLSLASLINQDKSYGPTVESEAVRCLGTCLFIDPFCETEQSESVLSILSNIWTNCLVGSSKRPIEAVVAALDGWGLAFTRNQISLSGLLSNALKVTKLLDHDNHDLVCSALPIIGLLFEVSYDQKGGAPTGVSKKEVATKLSSIISEADRSASKQQRKDKKELARKVLATVDDNTLPNEKMTIYGKGICFSGWRRFIQLDFLRTLLGSGLQSHFAEGDTVRAILDISHIALQIPKKADRELRKAQKDEANQYKKEETIRRHKKRSDALAAMHGED
eukprot:Sspe_Gene.89253::Locus_61059_Transcript_1_1_Confidence_1.000_Length_1310::g.89253::m.89253